MIKITDITKRFGERKVLHGVSMEVRPGQLVALIGPSGCGKTTLTRCLTALEPFDEGEVVVDGLRLRQGMGAWDETAIAVRRQVGIVFQDLRLWPARTTLQQVTDGLISVKRLSRKDADAVARKWAGELGVAEHLDRYPANLSGGERQRVALARAAALEPGYLLLDEITSALDPILAGEVVTLLSHLKDRGMGLLLISHQLEFVRRCADMVYFMKEGRVWETGPPASVLVNPSTPELGEFVAAVRRGW